MCLAEGSSYYIKFELTKWEAGGGYFCSRSGVFSREVRTGSLPCGSKGKEVGIWNLESSRPELKIQPYRLLCDLGQVTGPLWVCFFDCKWGRMIVFTSRTLGKIK